MAHKTKGFVFHHVPKTGGSSICNWLGENFPNDMVWIGRVGVKKWPPLESDCWKSLQKSFPVHIPIENAVKVLKSSIRTRHLSTWHFAFMRNPYEWFESFFWYRRGKKEPRTKKIYGKNWCERDERSAWKKFIQVIEAGKGESSQSHWIKTQGVKKISFLGDYANLENDFKEVMGLFGVDTNFSLPVINTSPINDRIYLWDDKESLAKIKTFLKEDIELYEKTFNKRATYE